MAAKGFVYRAVMCGVNLSNGQKPLAYAEADAEAMYRTYTSALGPTDSETSLLLTGNMASRTSVVQRLSRLAQLRTDYLLFYFSGHGSEDGIALADGILKYDSLHQLLGRIRAQASLVILDACHSGAYGDEHVDVAGGGESWADVLAHAMPGERMFFATRPDENAAEGGDVQGGHFTWALLQALYRGQGELRSTTGSRFLSDIETFNLANAILRKRWPDDAWPYCMNLAGDFPMLKSHAEVPIGAGEVAITPLPRQIAVNVTVRILGRSGVPVHLRSRLLDPNGILVADETRQLIPKANNSAGTYSIDLTAVAHTSHLGFYQDRVPLQWVVELVDPWHRYVLGQANLTLAYKSGNSSVRSPVGY